MRWGHGVVALSAAALLAACAPGGEPTPAPAPEEPTPAEVEPAPAEDPDVPADGDGDGEDSDGDEAVEITETVIATGLEAPWDIAFTPDGSRYLTERDSGRLVELSDDGSLREVQTFDIDPAGEGGLLGLAASPTFDDDGYLYAYFTAAQDNRVVRFQPGGEPEPVLTGIPKGRIHNGGRVAFGPDDLLYVTTGDSGNPALSQDADSLAGKILRLTPGGEVPDDNPEAGSPVYASGIRNSQGLAWDDDGTLYAAEFGPDVDDAVLRVEPGSDQGWGPETANAPAGERPFPDPVDVRQPPNASWSGAAVLRDGAIPQWEGDLFVSALRGERLWRYPLGGGEPEELYAGEYGRLRQVEQGPDGALWILTSNRDGRGSPVEDDDRVIRIGPAD